MRRNRVLMAHTKKNLPIDFSGEHRCLTVFFCPTILLRREYKSTNVWRLITTFCPNENCPRWKSSRINRLHCKCGARAQTKMKAEEKSSPPLQVAVYFFVHLRGYHRVRWLLSKVSCTHKDGQHCNCNNIMLGFVFMVKEIILWRACSVKT